MEKLTKDIIVELYTLRSKEDIVDFVKERYELLIEFFTTKGYKMDNDEFKENPAILSDNEKRLFNHYEEIKYIFNGIVHGHWLDDITDPLEKGRRREIREEVEEILGGHGRNSEIYFDKSR